MANFTTITLDINTNTNGSPTWTPIGAASTEVRWSDQSGQTAVASASWPAMVRPVATQIVPYMYAYTADAVGLLALGATYALSNYNQCRWNWDNLGTFASAPIWTAYASSAHGSISRGDGSLLGGHASDTGGTARSYLKCNAYGISGETPSGVPSNASVVTDGSTGSLATSTGAWLTNFQGLQGDNDYVVAGATPAATTAGTWPGMLVLYTGPNVTPSTWTPVISVKYTWT